MAQQSPPSKPTDTEDDPMSFQITMRRNGRVTPVHAPGMDEEAARLMSGRLALLCERVTLMELDEDGTPNVVGRWERGKVDNSAPAIRKAARVPVVIDHEPDEVDAPEDGHAAALAEDVTAQIENAAADDHDDESHHYTARCMKCRENREFVGHVVELANGSKAARGTCPVCGTKVTRMVARTTPVDEWDEDTPPAETPVEDTEADTEGQEPGDAEDADVEPDVDAAGEPVSEDVTDNLAVAAVAFSDAVQEDAELTPAVAEVVAEANPPKRQRKSRAKAKPEPETPAAEDADVARVMEMQVAECPICGQAKVPFQSRGGITYFLTHPGRDGKGNATERCPNSLGSDGLAGK